MEALASKKRRLNTYECGDSNLYRRRKQNDQRLKSLFEDIFEKYERDFDGIGDEIDLETGEIVVDNGHISRMRHEKDAGHDSDDSLESLCDASENEEDADSRSDCSDSHSSLEEILGDDRIPEVHAKVSQTLPAYSSHIRQVPMTARSKQQHCTRILPFIDLEGLSEDELSSTNSSSSSPMRMVPQMISRWNVPDEEMVFGPEPPIDPRWRVPTIPIRPDHSSQHHHASRRFQITETPENAHPKHSNTRFPPSSQIPAFTQHRPTHSHRHIGHIEHHRLPSTSQSEQETSLTPTWTEADTRVLRYLQEKAHLSLNDVAKYFPRHDRQSLPRYAAPAQGLTRRHDPPLDSYRKRHDHTHHTQGFTAPRYHTNHNDGTTGRPKMALFSTRTLPLQRQYQDPVTPATPLQRSKTVINQQHQTSELGRSRLPMFTPQQPITRSVECERYAPFAQTYGQPTPPCTIDPHPTDQHQCYHHHHHRKTTSPKIPEQIKVEETPLIDRDSPNIPSYGRDHASPTNQSPQRDGSPCLPDSNNATDMLSSRKGIQPPPELEIHSAGVYASHHKSTPDIPSSSEQESIRIAASKSSSASGKSIRTPNSVREQRLGNEYAAEISPAEKSTQSATQAQITLRLNAQDYDASHRQSPRGELFIQTENKTTLRSSDSVEPQNPVSNSLAEPSTIVDEGPTLVDKSFNHQAPRAPDSPLEKGPTMPRVEIPDSTTLTSLQSSYPQRSSELRETEPVSLNTDAEASLPEAVDQRELTPHVPASNEISDVHDFDGETLVQPSDPSEELSPKHQDVPTSPKALNEATPKGPELAQILDHELQETRHEEKMQEIVPTGALEQETKRTNVEERIDEWHNQEDELQIAMKPEQRGRKIKSLSNNTRPMAPAPTLSKPTLSKQLEDLSEDELA